MNTIEDNKKFVTRHADLCKLGHFITPTEEYGTMAGNRRSLATTLYQAIIRTDTGKIFNRVQIKSVETDLIRAFKPTKSTSATHEKKIVKLYKQYPDLVVKNFGSN